ncbi:MAG: ATP-binding cassette domain-containing protein [Ktedonobacterales bacterium]
MQEAPVAIPSAPPTPESDATDDLIVRTFGLTKQFGSRVAVNKLDLEVHRGDVFALLGPNGSGKTTTLRMLLGLVWPTAGVMSMFGGDMRDTGQRRLALQRVGAVVEQPSFYPFLSGRENLLGIATFAGLPDNATTRARVETSLQQVALAPRAKDAYRRYSLGMKQRLGIAAALLTNPELIILDEPTNGLDPAGVVEVRGLISQLARRGITVLLSSHLLYEVQQVCTRVAIIKDGILLAQGPVNQLLGAHNGVQLGFNQPEQLFAAVQTLQEIKQPWLHGAQYVRPEPGAWTPPGGWLLLVDAPAEHAADVNALLAGKGLFPAEVRRREASLEQFFLQVTGDAQATPGMPGAQGTPPSPPVPPAASSSQTVQTVQTAQTAQTQSPSASADATPVQGGQA